MSENNDYIQLPPLKKDTPSDVVAFIAVYDAQRSPFCFRTAVFRSQRPPIFS